jgi:ribonuclease E
MVKKMLIDATHAEETRVVVVDGNKVEEFDFESQSKRQLAGNIYLAKVTRVEPSLQAAFVDYGGNRHGFLAFSEIHPDYYQIPVADREALIAEERAYAEQQRAEDEERAAPKRRSRSRRKPKAEETVSDDAVVTQEVDGDAAAAVEGAETPVVEAVTTDVPAGMETFDIDENEVEPITDDNDDDDAPTMSDATAKDEGIESVADEDDSEDVRPLRKPRPKRYKIQEVVKVRQILLVQVVKEERGNKGAALTTYLSLAGRYCVLMPNTARGGGISRKITNAPDRKKLKEIANEIDVPDGAGLIVRTAGAKRTKTEIKRDYEYLLRLWEQIRELTLKSIAPAKIYEEGNLIKRSIRDLYNRDIDEVFVEGADGYRTAKDFMKMIMPSHAKNVKNYQDQLPLFARYQVETYLAGMFNPTVQLPSGGYIVIDTTEALVAVDVNSGRATKEGSIEQTALKTNLEASDEVARQLRLRDLAGLIVIDYIDMDERRNNASVEKRLKDKLKTDRARIQVGRISGFGLMEMSRQRLRPGMIEATTMPCVHCHGTGLLRSDDNMALSILRQLEEEGVRGKSKEVLVKAPIAIANFIMNQKRDHVAQIEARYGLSVRVEGDPFMVSPDFSLEKFKTASRIVPEVIAAIVSDASMMDDFDDAAEVEVEVDEAPEATPGATQEPNSDASSEDGTQPKRRRRRRRRRRSGSGEGAAIEAAGTDSSTEAAPVAVEAPAPSQPSGDAPVAEGQVDATPDAPVAEAEAEAEAKPAPKKRTRSRSKKPAPDAVPPQDASEATEVAVAPADVVDEDTPVETETAKPAPKPRRSRARKPAAPKEEVPTAAATETVNPAPGVGEPVVPVEVTPVVEPTPEPKPRKTRTRVSKPVVVEVEAVAEAAPETKSDAPKKKGWWSIGR